MDITKGVSGCNHGNWEITTVMNGYTHGCIRDTIVPHRVMTGLNHGYGNCVTRTQIAYYPKNFYTVTHLM